MNTKKLRSLLAAARLDAAPVPPPDFAETLVRAIRQLPAERPVAPPMLFEQLNRLFPRLAPAAVALVLFCVAADYVLTATGLPELGDGAAQISSQWFLDGEDL